MDEEEDGRSNGRKRQTQGKLDQVWQRVHLLTLSFAVGSGYAKVAGKWISI